MKAFASLVRRFPGIFLVLMLPVVGHCAGVGDAAPDWNLGTPHGASVNFHEHSRDQVSVVLFWATWCPFCRTLMPHIQTIATEFRDKPVRFYAINVWEDGDPVEYLKKQEFTFALLLSGEAAAAAWGVKGTPGLFVVDQDHRIAYQRVSGTDDTDVEIALRDTLNSLLVP